MNMKLKAMLLGLSIMTALPVCAQKPVYLDTSKPIEERVKDALNRMTLEEKVRMIQFGRCTPSRHSGSMGYRWSSRYPSGSIMG